MMRGIDDPKPIRIWVDEIDSISPELWAKLQSGIIVETAERKPISQMVIELDCKLHDPFPVFDKVRPNSSEQPYGKKHRRALRGGHRW